MADRLEFHELPEDVQEALELIGLPGQEDATSFNTLKDIVASYPGFVSARLNLAALQLQADDIRGAEATYRSVLSDYPRESSAIGGLATVFAANKDLERAEQYARQAIDEGYDWAPLYGVIAEARESAGDVQSASAAYLQEYQRSPHAWNALENYCRLNNRPYLSPMEAVPQPIDASTLKTLFTFIDHAAHTPDQDGAIPGCDHTFRFTEQWAKSNRLDIIDLYQFLNAQGGFCDCEVCFNVEPRYSNETSEVAQDLAEAAGNNVMRPEETSVADEFFIVRTDGNCLDIHNKQYELALKPKSFSSSPTTPDFGHYAIKSESMRMSFTFEQPGIQVVVEEGNIGEDKLLRIMSEILQNIEQVTGQKVEFFVL